MSLFSDISGLSNVNSYAYSSNQDDTDYSEVDYTEGSIFDFEDNEYGLA